MARARIVVIGSANADLTVLAERLPRPGEPVLGGRLRRGGGGNGANQAVAAARAGADVAFVARLGRDDIGSATIAALQGEGVDTYCVRLDETEPSGVALIVVDRSGENLIAVAPGANERLCPDDVRAAASRIAMADAVLLQLEVPIETVRAGVEAADAAAVPVMLNPAPAPQTGRLDDLLDRVDVVTPNRGEAARLLGCDPGKPPREMARRLAARVRRAAVLTVGAEGAVAAEGGRDFAVPAPEVQTIDTVGAGDCFCGALAVVVAEGRPLPDAVRFAVCAAALSVRAAGARTSLPRRTLIDEAVADWRRQQEDRQEDENQ